MIENVKLFLISFFIFSVILIIISITSNSISEAIFASFILFPLYALLYTVTLLLEKITYRINFLKKLFRFLVIALAIVGLLGSLSIMSTSPNKSELSFGVLFTIIFISPLIPLYRKKLFNLLPQKLAQKETFEYEKAEKYTQRNQETKTTLEQKNQINRRIIIEEKFSSDLALLKRLQNLDPYEFEKLVAEVLKAYFGEKAEVILTQSSRDKGVDIVINLNDDVLGGKYLVQVKRYKTTVGEPELKQFLGTLHDHRAKGIFVTLSNFSEPAKKLAKEHNITLIDGEKLIEMIKRYKIIEIEQSQELAS